MDDKTLQTYVEKVSVHFFKRPFKHQARFNGRLRTTGGRYIMASHNLEFNHLVLDYFDEEEFLGVVKHELCHYHLHLMGKGYRHKDKDFKRLLDEVGGHRYVKSLLAYTAKEKLSYKCYSCGTIFYRYRKIDTTKFVCGKCGGRLYSIDNKGVNDENNENNET